MSASDPADTALEAAAGGLGRRMARGTLAQQAGQAVAVVVGLVTATALGRSLTLAEFGVYGFVISFSTYLYFAVASAETAAVNAIAAAADRDERDAAVTTALIVYAVLGAIAGLLIAGAGVLLVGALGFGRHLAHEARIGVVMVGVVTAVGWPAKTFQDLLRADHRFVSASLAEATGTLLMGGTLVGLLAAGAPLWSLIAVGSAIPAYTGLCGTAVALSDRRRPRLRRVTRSRRRLRDFLTLSGAMFAVAASDLVINSLDRTILAAFRAASSLGLYEAAVRPSTFIRVFSGTFSVTLLPVLSRLGAAGDAARERLLLLRGTKYMLVAIGGPTVVLMVLADRVLAVWLGDRFVHAAPALVAFLVWWLLNPNLTIANTMLVVERGIRKLTVYAWTTAAVNLVASVLLTWWLGVAGVAIGTTLGYLTTLPFYLRYALSRRTVDVGDFWREVWRPAYGSLAVLAALVGLARLVVPLDHLPEVLTLAGVAVVGYWACFARFGIAAEERAMVRRLMGRASP